MKRDLSVEVEYDRDDIPEELLTTVERSVEFIVPILPRWCSMLYVNYSNKSESDLRVHISVKNRWATLEFHPGHFNRSEYDRRVELMHEVVHLYLDPMSDVFDEMVGDNTVAKAWWTNAVERSTQDLAENWERLLPSLDEDDDDDYLLPF